MRLLEQPGIVDPDILWQRSPDVLGVELDGQRDVLALISNLQTVAIKPSITAVGNMPYDSFTELGIPRNEAARLALMLTDEMAKADGPIGPVSFRAPEDRESGRALRDAVDVSAADIMLTKLKEKTVKADYLPLGIPVVPSLIESVNEKNPKKIDLYGPKTLLDQGGEKRPLFGDILSQIPYEVDSPDKKYNKNLID